MLYWLVLVPEVRAQPAPPATPTTPARPATEVEALKQQLAAQQEQISALQAQQLAATEEVTGLRAQLAASEKAQASEWITGRRGYVRFAGPCCCRPSAPRESRQDASNWARPPWLV